MLTNASRFTEQGEIRIHAFFRENEVVISVSDTGTGIPADKLDTLFQDYQQVSLHDATPGRGKGLGLAIAKHFVMMHGGQIWAESQVNQGSTFYFTLPLVAVELGRVTTSSPLHEDLGEPSSTVVVLDSSEYVTSLSAATP